MTTFQFGPVEPPGGVVIRAVERHRLEQGDEVRPEPGVEVDRRLRVERDEDEPARSAVGRATRLIFGLSTPPNVSSP